MTWYSELQPEVLYNPDVAKSSMEDSILISPYLVPSISYWVLLCLGGPGMDMSSQFWHVRACPNARRDGPSSALFLWVNKVIGKRKAKRALYHLQKDFSLMGELGV